MKQIELKKGPDLFVFRYEPGEEQHVRDELVEHVRRGVFDWIDAAMLSYQLGLKIANPFKSE